MDAERKIKQARLALLFDHPFWGFQALSLELVEKIDMAIPTMGTDGTHLFYNPDFVEELTLQQLMGVIAHEIGHIILWHLPRRQGREFSRWNIAADYAVNGLILKEFELPKGICHNSDWDDKSAEWIYAQLPESETIGVGQGTLDSHEEWKDWGNGKDEDGEGHQDDIEQQWKVRTARAATRARMQGKLPGYIKSIIDGILQPKLPWKYILADKVTSTVKNNFRIVPPNKKHLWRGLYLPSTTGEEITIAAVVDSSGSISDDQIKEFISEIKGICESFENHTIYLFICDAHIQARYELHQFDPLPREFPGRGGTSFVEPLKEAESLPISCLIYLTDLYGTFPDKEPWYPVIWVATQNHGLSPWGTVITLD